jgi:hypothetical protein
MKIPTLGILLGLLAALFIGNVKAQEHRHPPQDQAIHEKFYKNWMMPDSRNISCCHDEDCKPAESRFENGRWLARHVGDEGTFTPVPPSKIEHDRDTPDGRSHLCGKRYGFTGGEFTVFCFIPGAGG